MDDYNPQYDKYPEVKDPERKIPLAFWLVLAVAIDTVAIIALIIWSLS